MASNRKYKNGVWKGESKKQEELSIGMFHRLTHLLADDFKYMSTNFDQTTGDCGYTYTSTTHSYYMLVSRTGKILQESLKSI